MKQGRIVKVVSNRYTIWSDGEEYTAVPRGKLRKDKAPLTGDIVNFEEIEDSVVIDSIHERTNRLLRPAVVNVDQALIVTSLKDPDYNPHLLNRLIFLVLLSGSQPVLCFTKKDLLSEAELEKLSPEVQKYKDAGYTVVFSDPLHQDEELVKLLKDRITVLCGQSGAGKSSLLNRLEPSFKLRVQETSKALGRGKHTTRHCQLHPVAGGLVADTPGFSSLDFNRLDLSSLDQLIPDFQPWLDEGCRFADCIHINEPDCCIKKHVEAGEINPDVYEDYKQLMTEFKNRKKY